eukprot:2690396-Rhodomonas_salina.1
MYQAQLDYYIYTYASAHLHCPRRLGGGRQLEGATQKHMPWSLETGALQCITTTALTAIPSACLANRLEGSDSGQIATRTGHLGHSR